MNLTSHRFFLTILDMQFVMIVFIQPVNRVDNDFNKKKQQRQLHEHFVVLYSKWQELSDHLL